MKQHQLSTLAGLALPLVCFGQQSEQIVTSPKRNVLFIMVDDLRPELNCYHHSDIISPNIDQLASQGTVFLRAYCNVPVSGASRASLLTGARPTRKRYLNYDVRASQQNPSATSLPQWFKEHGYVAISNGKVFHHQDDCDYAWDENWRDTADIKCWRNFISPTNLEFEKHGRGEFFEMLDVDDDDYVDGRTAQKTIRDLQKLKNSEKPFFLAVGMRKPHLPFNPPQKYWDMYDAGDIQLPANYEHLDSSIPQRALHTWGELRSYHGVPKEGPLSHEQAIKMIHGYRASVTYVDAQIGLILDELRRLELDKNTIIVLLGDHGWNLGEHSLWCKHANFKTSLNAPLIIYSPFIKNNKVSKEIVEFIDIYPTVCDLVSLPKPQHLEGESLVNLCKGKTKGWKNYAVCKYFEGMTYVEGNYAYTEWINKKSRKPEAKMLFNLKKDPHENENIISLKKYQKLANKMQKELYAKRGKSY